MNDMKEAEGYMNDLAGPPKVWREDDPESGDGEFQEWESQPTDASSALHQTREAAHDAFVHILRAMEGQQKQINALSRKVNEHRHALGQGQGWSGKPEF